MKKLLYILLFFCTAVGFFQCKKTLKNVNDYYPKVKTTSVDILSDGSVEVKGEVISEGDAPVQYVGFCMSTNPVPKMLDDQIIANLQGNNFSAIYPPSFDPAIRYYFRTWATNDNGYAYGNIIYIDSIVVPWINPPCSPAMNTIDIIGTGSTETYTNVDNPTPLMGDSSKWFFTAKSNSNTVNFTFGSKPITRIYTIRSLPAPNEVYIDFSSTSLFFTQTLIEGSSVYVNQISPNLWEITLCNAPWNYSYNNNTYYMTTKFTCPL